jgi:hypothetical protein
MKNRIALVLAASLGLLGARAFVYETGWEMQSGGDFDGDGREDLVIVDKATGNYRVAYQNAGGNYSWASPRASGIENATALAIGRLNSLAFDSLALTGPNANRVNILNANSPATPGLPQSSFLGSLGPNGVAAVDIGGGGNTAHADLYVSSLYNGVSPFRQTLLRNDGSTNRTVITDTALALLRERLNRVLLHTNRAARLGMMDRQTSPTVDLFRVLDLSAGLTTSVDSFGTLRTPAPYEYVNGQFVRTNAYTQFIVYPPGGFYFYNYQVTEPVPNSYQLVYTNQFTVTNYIWRLFVLPGTNDTKLLVIHTNRLTAVVYRFDGLNAPVPVQQFNAPPGENFTGAGVLGNNGFMSYGAPVGENTSSSFQQWRWTGSGYSNVASGTLPRLNSYSAAGNVMQFRFEPFVNSNPTLLRVNNAGDWSSAPQIGGGNISVRTETFLNSTQGLVNPTANPLGPAHPLAAFALANQYSNQISLFSFSPPAGDKVSDVIISPAPGLYSAAVQLSFSAINPTDRIFVRLGNGSWTQWSNGLVLRLITNTTVQYYGQPVSNNAKSAIKSAHYAFSAQGNDLDSDNDGVPDFVEHGRGLDPNGGRDSDGDGYSDLEELIRGTDPLLAASAPTNFPHLDERAAFDYALLPRPWDGFANAVSFSATGMAVRAYDFQGSLLGVAVTTNVPRPFARLTNITVVAEDRLFAVATDQHFNIATTNADKAVGREMLLLTEVPALSLPAIAYTFSSNSLATEASNWVSAASQTLTNLPRALLTNQINVNSTLIALLYEKKVAEILGQRGTNWWTNLTLFPFRVADAARSNVPSEALLAIESRTPTQPGYNLKTMHATISNLVENSGAPAIVALRQVTRDVFRISSSQNNTNPATFELPVDALRRFLWTGTLESNYLFWATTAGSFASASSGASNILAAVPPRPVSSMVLVVRADTAGSCRVLDRFGGGSPVSLLDSARLPFSFPDNFDLLPGSLVEITGYTDLTNSPCGLAAVEVISALLCSVPIASDTDADGDLLIDTWEKQFFGHQSAADPFVDSDGDGYSNLQEMLEGSDPADFYGRPSGPVVPFNAPALSLGESGGQMELSFSWPSTYLSQFEFKVQHTPALGVPFTELVAAGPIGVGGNQFKMTFPAPATPQHYFYLTVRLR